MTSFEIISQFSLTAVKVLTMFPVASSLAHLCAYCWRPARVEDIPAVCAMLAAAAEIDKLFLPPSEERLAHLYGMLGEHLEESTLLALAEYGSVGGEAFILAERSGMAHQGEQNRMT